MRDRRSPITFSKVSAVLADYGFITIRLSSDWGGADFIAQHCGGLTFLKVQLKGRLTFDMKYRDRNLHVCFPSKDEWFVYPHDELLDKVLGVTKIAANGLTEAWRWILVSDRPEPTTGDVASISPSRGGGPGSNGCVN